MKRMLLIPVLAASLVACGDKSPASVGVTLENTSAASVDKTSTVGGDKKIDQSDKAAVSVKMAAPVLLARAAKGLLSEVGIKAPYRAKFLAASDQTLAGKVGSKLPQRTTVAAILAIASAFDPAIGWPDGDEASFMIRNAALINFVDAISAEVVGKLGDSALRDPGAAQQAIISNIAAIPPETLEAIWNQSVKDAKGAGRPSANLAGSNAPIEYKLGGQVISIGPQGMWLIAEGGTLFGEGKIGGKAVDLSLETSLSTGLSRKLTLDTKAATTESESVKVDASVKN